MGSPWSRVFQTIWSYSHHDLVNGATSLHQYTTPHWLLFCVYCLLFAPRPLSLQLLLDFWSFEDKELDYVKSWRGGEWTAKTYVAHWETEILREPKKGKLLSLMETQINFGIWQKKKDGLLVKLWILESDRLGLRPILPPTSCVSFSKWIQLPFHI